MAVLPKKKRFRKRSEHSIVPYVPYIIVIFVIVAGIIAGSKIVQVGPRPLPRAQTAGSPTCSFTSSPTQVCPNTSVTYKATCSNCTSMSIAKSGNNTNTWTEIASCNSTSCTGTTTFPDSGGGGYFVACNAYNATLKCTGNPYCASYPCGSGYYDCGSNDHVSVFSLGNNCPVSTPTIEPTVVPRPSPPTSTPNPLPANTCLCDLGAVTGSNCTSPNLPFCTDKFTCKCLTSAPPPSRTPTPFCLANGLICIDNSYCCSNYCVYNPSVNRTICSNRPTSTPTRTPTKTRTPTPGCTPSVEICDGKDNDCDGLIDEGAVCPSKTPTRTRTPTPGGALPTRTRTPTKTRTPTPGSGNCPNGNLGNINCDSGGLINEIDLSILLTKWHTGGCPAPAPSSGQRSADLDGDCKVDETDLSKLLINWKTS